MILRLRRPALWCRLVLRRRDGECGSAVVEFVVLGVLMLVPLLYLVMTMARLQAGAYAASAAAREAARGFVTARTVEAAEPRALGAASIAFEDQGFRAGEGVLTMECDGTPCLRPEGRIEMVATVTVPLPLVPAFARDLVPLEVPVSASHVAVVDRFRVGP